MLVCLLMLMLIINALINVFQLKQQQGRFPIDPEMLKAAKSADRKLLLVPLLLVIGRSFGIGRFFVNIFSKGLLKKSLPPWDKALFTLEVGIVASDVCFM